MVTNFRFIGNITQEEAIGIATTEIEVAGFETIGEAFYQIQSVGTHIIFRVGSSEFIRKDFTWNVNIIPLDVLRLLKEKTLATDEPALHRAIGKSIYTSWRLPEGPVARRREARAQPFGVNIALYTVDAFTSLCETLTSRGIYRGYDFFIPKEKAT